MPSDSSHKKQKQVKQCQAMSKGHSRSTVTNLQSWGPSGCETAKFESTSGNKLAIDPDFATNPSFICEFCQTSNPTEVTGPMQHFAKKKQVFGSEACGSKVIHVHQRCMEWAPRIYYDGTVLKNLEIEVARAGKMKCASCGLKGAALGCFAKSCRISYHAPCAYENIDCRWDTEAFLMLCPAHNSLKFPDEVKRSAAKKCPTPEIFDGPDIGAASPAGFKHMVLSESARSGDGKILGKYPHKKSPKRAASGSGGQGDSYHKKRKQLGHLEMPHDQELTSIDSGSQLSVDSDSAIAPEFICAFCQTWKPTEVTGLMQHFAKGKQVSGSEACHSNVIHVHIRCMEWAPRIYYEGTLLRNLDKEVARAAKLKCASCRLKGAALGCFEKSCCRSYHAPCAYEIADCRWDTEDFLMLCPVHNSLRFPREVKKSSAKKSARPNIILESKNSGESDPWAASATRSKNWVLCGSALSNDEKFLLDKFANSCGATVTKVWNPDVTHVIATTDANRACSRTFIVLMAILKGRWILEFDWIKECLELKRLLDEEPYEISLDNHGCCYGPRTGRQMALSNAPKLFSGFKFFYSGDIVPTYKRDLQDLVVAAGGTILESQEQLQSANCEHFSSGPSTTVVVYNEDAAMVTGASNVRQQKTEAQMLATETGSQVISHSLLLDSIGSCKLRPFLQK